MPTDVKLVVCRDARGWHVQGPDAVRVDCYTLTEAERVARDMMAGAAEPVDLLVLDAYHRVIRLERARG